MKYLILVIISTLLHSVSSANTSQRLIFGTYVSQDISICKAEIYKRGGKVYLTDFGSVFRHGRWGTCNGTSVLRKKRNGSYYAADIKITYTVIRPGVIHGSNGRYQAIFYLQ